MRTMLAIVGAVVMLLPGPVAAQGQDVVLSAVLSPSKAIPVGETSASGTVVITINADRTAISYRFTFKNLSGPVTVAAVCSDEGPVLEQPCAFAIPAISGGPSPITGTLTITPSQAEILESGRAAAELVTAKYPASEISGLLKKGVLPNTATEAGQAEVDERSLLPLVLGALGAVVLTMRRKQGLRTLD